MAATIRDIKNKTGLSLATISKYLNGGNVLPENQKKIEDAIEELHYEVNELARGLATNRTRTVGVVVFDIGSIFNGVLLHHIGNVLRKNGYGMLICDSGNDEKLEEQNIHFLINKKVDGIIVVPASGNGAFLDPARIAGIPVVLLDREIEDANCDCVHIDNRRAIKSAVDYLVTHNHKAIAMIGSEKIATGRDRLKGFLKATEDYGIKIPDKYIKRGTHSLEYGYQALKELMSLDPAPTAIVLGNYEVTLGAVMALNESGMSCPEDVSLFGFDDLILDHVVKPQISRVVQPMEEMGTLATELLLDKIREEEDNPPRNYILDTNIIEGDSVRML